MERRKREERERGSGGGGFRGKKEERTNSLELGRHCFLRNFSFVDCCRVGSARVEVGDGKNRFVEAKGEKRRGEESSKPELRRLEKPRLKRGLFSTSPSTVIKCDRQQYSGGPGING